MKYFNLNTVLKKSIKIQLHYSCEPQNGKKIHIQIQIIEMRSNIIVLRVLTFQVFAKVVRYWLN